MLQVFHMNVAIVDRDVAYVTMAKHVCCKPLFQIFYLFFSNECYKCFYLMLHMFHTYVANVSDTCFKYFICLKRMLQICSSRYFKVDQVLYMLQYNSPVIAACCSCWDAMHACGKWRDGALHGYGR